MSRSSSQVRGLLELDIPTSSLALQNYGDTGPGFPATHARKASQDTWSAWPNTSREPGFHPHKRIPSLQTSQLPPIVPSSTISQTPTNARARISNIQAGQLFLDSPGPPTSRTITQSFYQPSSRPASRGRIGPDELPPPPPIGTNFFEQTSSPTGSRSSSLARGRLGSEDLLPPRSIGASYLDHEPSPTGSRSSSVARGRLDSVTSSGPTSRANSPSTTKLNKKRTWIRNKSQGRMGSMSAMHEPWAFIVGTPEKTEYSLQYYIARHPVPELWNEQGDLFVHLFGESEGPSFRLDSRVIASSKNFQSLLSTSQRSRESSVADISRGMRQASLGENGHVSRRSLGEMHLVLPITLSNPLEPQAHDLENLVAIRNLFAFLVGQILVGTPKQPTLFAVFKNIAGLLEYYEFTNHDGSTFGEIAKQNFLGYVEDLRLDDVRSSREKTLEALVLGEKMKSWQLYNEGFVHAIGKWEDICASNSETMRMITPVTRKRMEKSHMDLRGRLHAVELRLNEFDFPSLFQGIAVSSSFQKVIDVKAWRSSWVSMRKFTMNYYKTRHGAWPPKASSKKNDFEESGLNRIVLQELYKDFCDLYDMLVDKTNLTTRSADLAAHDERLAESDVYHSLRHLMSEFDRSSPPVKPPVPYDLCLLPDLKFVVRDYANLSEKKQAKERARKLKSDEINLALMQSYDRDSLRATPFLQAFMAYERSIYHGKTMEEVVDHRIGQWIFLYVILQSLPLVVVDAPAIRWTDGVEYFLSEVPKGTPPWLRDDATDRGAYRTANGQALTNAKADAISNSVEGIYSRSHCWKMALVWSHGTAKMPIDVQTTTKPRTNQRQSKRSFSNTATDRTSMLKDLPPPPPIPFSDAWNSSRDSSARSSIAVLDDLPLPPPLNVDIGGPGRKASTPDLSKTFDDILGPAASTPTMKKRGWASFSG